MTTFEDIINQSFIEDQNKYNNRQIDSSEKNNVNNLFISSILYLFTILAKMVVPVLSGVSLLTQQYCIFYFKF